MGADIVSVGSAGGKSVFTFTGAGQDSGPLDLQVQVDCGRTYGTFECSRWSKWVLQLVGTGVGYQVTLYGTIDVATAYNQPGNNAEWFELPSPQTENGFAWANPVSLAPGKRACYVNTPLVAIRAVSSALPGSTTSGIISLLMFVCP